MPVFSPLEIIRITIKLALVAIIIGLMFNFSSDFKDIVTTLLGKIGLSLDGLNGIDLGWFGGVIGLTAFLNTLMGNVITAGHILIGGVIAIFTFKYSVQAYAFLTKP